MGRNQTPPFSFSRTSVGTRSSSGSTRCLSATRSRTVRRLLGGLIKAARPPLQVAEIEGDAVFFYAIAERGDIDEVARAVKDQIPTLFRTFEAEPQRPDSAPLVSLRGLCGRGRSSAQADRAHG